jgi:hypothetical protein
MGRNEASSGDLRSVFLDFVGGFYAGAEGDRDVTNSTYHSFEFGWVKGRFVVWASHCFVESEMLFDAYGT